MMRSEALAATGAVLGCWLGARPAHVSANTPQAAANSVPLRFDPTIEVSLCSTPPTRGERNHSRRSYPCRYLSAVRKLAISPTLPGRGDSTSAAPDPEPVQTAHGKRGKMDCTSERPEHRALSQVFGQGRSALEKHENANCFIHCVQ